MSLATYHKKRNFKVTPEPRGNGAGRKKSVLRFVIQKHAATRLHYDFRLELDGVLKSWAVPKGPSLDPSKKVLAVQVEDHPIEYGDFEGVIPKGQYGGGTVLLWDSGTWEPLHDPREGFESGRLHFALHGKKVKGEWALVRMHGPAGDGGKNWLLMKVKDRFADPSHDVLQDEPLSVKSRRSMDEIAGDRDDVWSDEAKKTAELEGAKRHAMPDKLVPQLAVLAKHPPQGDHWIHEIKFDGYRMLAFIKSGQVTLKTRRGLDWTEKFPALARALAKIKADSAIIDGELSALDKQGRSNFQALQEAIKAKDDSGLVYYAFDLPFRDGLDLRQVPLIERKEQLKQLLENSRAGERVRFSDHFQSDGQRVLDNACKMGLEGIISKQADAPYVSRRDPTWLKSKCTSRQEFVIIGYTDPQGSRTGFGSLLLGHYDKKRLVYAGRVGTGFDDKLLRQMHAQLKTLEQKAPPTDEPPPPRERRAAHWVTPQLVAEVRFTGWTNDGMLRHPAFIALRSDKPASQIVREVPVEPEKVEEQKSESANQESGNGRRKTMNAKRHSRRASSAANGSKVAEDSAGRNAGVMFTHPDKLLYADEGISKQDLADYYTAVQQWMLPHVVDRPLALVRCPEGRSGQCFFQRNWSAILPRAIDKVPIGTQKGKEQHVMVHDLAGVLSMVQIGVLELHTWNCRAKDIEHPDQLVFDLDPGPGVEWKTMIHGAQLLKKALDGLHLPTFLKTSGGKGLHLTIPIEPTIDWDAAKSFCREIANSLVERSDLFVANMRKDLRGGKIYIDYNRNGRGATAVAPYSTRAREGAPVSMPIAWTDLSRVKSAAAFTVSSAPAHVRRRKRDPWEKFEKSRVDLRELVASS